MKDEKRTKAELIAELNELRRKLAELKESSAELRKIENKLPGSDMLLRSLMSHTAEGIARFEHDPGIPINLPVSEQVEMIIKTARIVDCNDAYAQSVGVKHAREILGKLYVSEILPGGPDVSSSIEKFITSGHRLVGLEIASPRPDGSKVYYLSDSFGVIEHDRLIGSWIMHRDITKIKEAEQELRASEDNYQSFVEHSAEGIALFQFEPGISVELPSREQAELIYQRAIVSKCNDAFAHSAGVSQPEDVIGRPFFAGASVSPEITINILEGFVTSGYRELDMEAIIARPDGSIRHLLVNTYGVIKSGKLVRSWGIHRDVTEQKEAEKLLLASEEKFRTFFESSRQGIVVHRMSAQGPDMPVEVNGELLDMVGYSREEFLKFSLAHFMEPEEQAQAPGRMKELFESGSVTFELNIIAKDGHPIPCIANVSLVELQDEQLAIVYLSDITERRLAEKKNAELEKQLQRSQRLEMVGTLAGNIAHDFNNILTPIVCYLETAQEDLSPSDSLYEDIQDIFDGTTRAQELVAQILTFSRQLEPEPQSLSVPTITKEALSLMRPIIPSSVKIQQRIHGSCQNIWADPSQIHQVVFNLYTNAFQALEEEKGTITIELHQVHIDAATAGLHSNIEPGDYIRLSVSDTGVGMDNDTRNRIFEPYFTTKERDKGSGLGLSVVYGIVRKNNGEIIVLSEPGRGSTFHVYLPIMEGAEKPAPKEVQLAEGGSESILVVDDEPSIIRSLTKLLVQLGYDVDGKNGCAEALEAFKNKIHNYDLVITDLTMPDMSGLEFAQELQRICPGLPIILTTGYEKDITGDIQKDYGIREIVGKPLIRQNLAAAIRRALDE